MYLILEFLRKASSRRWWFISIPAVLGIGLFAFGILLLPGQPRVFFSPQINEITVNLISQCADDKETLVRFQRLSQMTQEERGLERETQVAKIPPNARGRVKLVPTSGIHRQIQARGKIIFTRTGRETFEFVVDIFGVLDLLDTERQHIFDPIWIRERKLYDLPRPPASVDDYEKIDPYTVPHYCESIRVVVHSNPGLKVALSGELNLERRKQEISQTSLVLGRVKRELIQTTDFTNVLLPRFGEGHEYVREITLPESDSDDSPSELAGLRFSVRCEDCVRGGGFADLAFRFWISASGPGLLIDQHKNNPVFAIANEQYFPDPWEGERDRRGDADTVNAGYDLQLLPHSPTAVTLSSTWTDADYERRVSGLITFASVMMGLGLTLVIEVFIAALYHLFHVRPEK